MKETKSEIRIALFGARGSGKTTLLASYFGHQQRNSFQEKYGYCLEAEDASQGNELLSKYYRLEKGEFPLGTESFSKYIFGLKVHDLQVSSLNLTWFDYPGGWWESTPSDVEERETRLSAFANLLSSHVGILLIDGECYCEEGISYVRKVLDQFKNEARKIVDQLAASGSPLDELPHQWVIAISKADLLGPDETAEKVCKNIVSNAADQLAGVAKIFNSKGFGSQYLLLSSVRGDGAQVVDAHSYIGLQLVAPVALMAVLDDLARKAGRGYVYGIPRVIFERLSSLVDLIDKVDDFLPPKYQLVTHLLKALDLKEGLDKGVEYFRASQAKAAQKGQKLEAATAAMKAELCSDAAQIAFYRNQA